MKTSTIRPLCIALLLLPACFHATAAETKPQKNYATGRITLDGGKPITGEVDDYMISIYGVTEAGQKVQYAPAVQAGSYKQKLVPGQFAFETAKIKMKFGETVFIYDLVPVGKNWNKNRDAADGIVQEFIWKPTGPRDIYGAKPDPNNATHWHGLSVGMRFQLWREDTNKAPAKLPEGTKLVFTLKPTSKSIDGRTLEPITLERAWRPNDVVPNDDLNDLPPANYDLTGVAKLPDGSSRPMLFQGRGDHPKFRDSAKVTLERDSSLGGMWKQSIGWVTN